MQREAANRCITRRSSRRPTRYAACPRLSLVVSGHVIRESKLKNLPIALGVTSMARDTSELREELDKLSPKQKAELARMLIDSLDEDLNIAVRT